MLKIGITGGIGSGKTTVSKIFQTLQIPSYNSDLAAKTILTSSALAKEKIIESFGKIILLEDGSIDRGKLGEIVFSSNSQLQRLNKILHPLVAIDFMEWCNNQRSSYLLKEAAILFETGIYKELDAVILVVSDLETRINRIKMRDGLSEKQVLKRIDSQMEDNEKISLADYVIDNHGNKSLIPQVIKIHEDLISRSAKRA